MSVLAGRRVPALGREARAALARAESIFRRERPWLLWREEDGVLIVPPNLVYKLGGSAPRLFAHLEAGGRLGEIPGMDEGRAAEVLAFFEGLGEACAGRQPPEGALGRVAYGFDFTRLPVLGELALTYRCNARCRFCYAGCGESPCGPAPGGPSPPGAPGRAPGPADAAAREGEERELGTEEAKRVILAFRDEARIPFFSFTGGEPLLRRDLEELAAYARSLGLRVNLITNASLASPERARSLKAAGIDTAQASLESPEAAVHDGLCGVEGAFDRTVAGIEAMLAAGISVQTNSTVTAPNRASLPALPRFLARLGVARFSMNLFIPSGRGLGDAGLVVPYSEVGSLVDAVAREARLAGLRFFWYSPTPYGLFNPVARGLGNKSCAAADGLLHVNPRGEILPCSSWPEPLGSMLGEGGFRRAWFSDRAAWFKNKRFAPAACEGCAAFTACQGACPLYVAALGEGELERCREARDGRKGE